MNKQALASEIIADQERVIKEQLQYYKKLHKAILNDAEKIGAKIENLEDYLGMTGLDEGNYRRMIIRVVKQIQDQNRLRRIYFFSKTALELECEKQIQNKDSSAK